jgi:V/A-type H+-transporting ATPase subunit I
MDETDELRQRLAKLESFSCNDCFTGIDIDLRQLTTLENFVVKWGSLTAQNRQKIAKNYENISAAVMHIGGTQDKEIYMVICPKDLEIEADRILRSVDFIKLDPAVEYFDYPDKMQKMITKVKREIKARLKHLDEISNDYIEHYREDLNRCFSRVTMETKLEKVKEKIAATKHFVYVSAWVPEISKISIENYFESYEDRIILTFREIKSLDSSVKIPTRLKNNIAFRPFEELVKMYGIPSYDELDPTLFFALSYMMLFGAMFGDFGQGLVIFFAGWIFANKKNKAYGGILVRLGIASMVFGLIYDSFFGYEHVISKYFPQFKYFRPIDNINTVLMLSIGVGIVLLVMSFLFSIFNKLSRSDWQEGLFGRNGIAGLTLFLSVLLLVLDKALGITYVPGWLLVALAIVGVVLIVVREPLANLMTGHRPLYHERIGEYYVESGFDIFETFLSLLSNSVSFIRVGAFALNHVGLFIAFHTMAHIIGTLAGNIAMFIIGNLMVIFLEGLIVFIQGLRLVYYEMFSKYYKGEGILFEPDDIL